MQAAPTSAIVANIDWSSIDYIFFDMDGTILDLHFDNYFWLDYLPRVYAQHHQRDDIATVKRELNQRIMQNRGALQWYCLDYWSADLNLDIIELKHTISAKIQPLEHALDSLQYLAEQAKQGRGPQLWLTTNAHRAGLELKLQYVPIAPFFEHLISSHDFAYAKESPLFWQRFQAAFNFDPKRVLFIDDTPSVLRSAIAFGVGQVLLVARPDSQRPANPAEEFNAIDNLSALRTSHQHYCAQLD